MPIATHKPTTKAIKPDHEIKLTLKDGHAVAPARVHTMAVGETVRYASDDGEVRIQFREQSPFRTDNVTMTSVPGSVILTLVSDSDGDVTVGNCFITPKGGTEVGWGPDHPQSGIHQRVTRP